MSIIVAVEALNFGLSRIVEAAASRGHGTVLMTSDRSRYLYELSRIPHGAITVIDVDTRDSSQVLAAAQRLPEVVGVLRMMDSYSVQAIDLALELGLPHADRQAVAMLRDKGALRAHMYLHGLSNIRAVVFDPAETDYKNLVGLLKFPCIIKDSSGTASRNVWLVRHEEELPAVLGAARKAELEGGGKLIAEPYLIGPLYSAEAVSWDGKTRLLGVCSRTLSPEPYFREESLSFPVVLPRSVRQEVEDLIAQLLSSVGYTHGITHTEFIRTEGGIEIVEVNPRLGGAMIGECIRRTLGVDMHAALVDIALGRRPEAIDATLNGSGGIAMVAVYPPDAGVYDAVEGVDALKTHPGAVQFYPVLESGANVVGTHVQDGVIGFVLADGESAELALHNVWSAAGKLSVHMCQEEAVDSNLIPA